MSRWPEGYRPAHGTWQRYKWELRHGVTTCPECREAWKKYVDEHTEKPGND